jgi:hypothetical protein
MPCRGQTSMRSSLLPAFASALAALVLAGCASVATDVTVFDQTQKFAPTENVMVLLEYPPQPYLKVAMIEAQGGYGGSEAELFEAARKRARALGADAVVRVEAHAFYQPPALVYDPMYAYPYFLRYPYRTFYYPAYPFSPFPYDNYRWVGGGTVQTLKAVAIKFTAARPGEPPAAPD